MSEPTVRILFVCTGNICRSPTAEGVMRKLLETEGLAAGVHVASAGTHAYHEGDGADVRSAAAAAKRGIDLSRHVARRVRDADFRIYDFVFAMDRGHHAELLERAPREHQEKVRLFLPLAPELGRVEVPDPYYGGRRGFEDVLDMIETASRALLEELRMRLSSAPPRTK
jgi:protein-tyrosine phosphatase